MLVDNKHLMLEVHHGIQLLNNLQCVRLWFFSNEGSFGRAMDYGTERKREPYMPFGMKVTQVHYKIWRLVPTCPSLASVPCLVPMLVLPITLYICEFYYTVFHPST